MDAINDRKVITIAGDGTTNVPVKPGQRYALGASSPAWTGSLAVNWKGTNDVLVAFPDSPLTANGGFEFVAPANTVALVMSGTSGTTTVQIAPIKP